MALSLYVAYCRWQCSVWVPTAHRSHFCRSREEKLTVYVAKRPFALFCPRVQDNILYSDILIGSLKVKYSERLTGNTLKDTAQKTQKNYSLKGARHEIVDLWFFFLYSSELGIGYADMFIFLNISGTINTKLNMKKLFFLTYLSIKICGTLIKRSPMETGCYSILYVWHFQVDR